jgi:hypothetical protein
VTAPGDVSLALVCRRGLNWMNATIASTAASKPAAAHRIRRGPGFGAGASSGGPAVAMVRVPGSTGRGAIVAGAGGIPNELGGGAVSGGFAGGVIAGPGAAVTVGLVPGRRVIGGRVVASGAVPGGA